jgi:hypothetical protein
MKKRYGGHMGKYGGHMGKNGEPIYDLGHMGISLELNSGTIMADIWELPVLAIAWPILDFIAVVKADFWLFGSIFGCLVTTATLPYFTMRTISV